MLTSYILHDYPDVIRVFIGSDGRCTGSIWWQGPGEPQRVERMGADPYEGMTEAELLALGFERDDIEDVA